MEQYNLTQLANKIAGFLDVETTAKIESWRQTRLLASVLYNTAGKTFKKGIKPEQIIKLPGDKKTASRLEEMREVFKQMVKDG